MKRVTIINLTGDTLLLQCQDLNDLKLQISSRWGILPRLILLVENNTSIITQNDFNNLSEQCHITLLKDVSALKVDEIIYVLKTRTVPSSYWQRSIITHIDILDKTFIVNYLNDDNTLKEPEYPYGLPGKKLSFNISGNYAFPEILKDYQIRSNWIGFNQKRQYILALNSEQRRQMLNILGNFPNINSGKWWQDQHSKRTIIQDKYHNFIETHIKKYGLPPAIMMIPPIN
jgi:hypothetical protein